MLPSHEEAAVRRRIHERGWSYVQPRAIFPEPLFPLVEVGHHLVDFVPEGVCVISVMDVAQLVDHDVVDDGLGGHHALPVEC